MMMTNRINRIYLRIVVPSKSRRPRNLTTTMTGTPAHVNHALPEQK